MKPFLMRKVENEREFPLCRTAHAHKYDFEVERWERAVSFVQRSWSARQLVKPLNSLVKRFVIVSKVKITFSCTIRSSRSARFLTGKLSRSLEFRIFGMFLFGDYWIFFVPLDSWTTPSSKYGLRVWCRWNFIGRGYK